MTVRAVLLLSLVLVAAPAFGQGTIAGTVGWGMAWVVGDAQVQYALVDRTDPCGFSITSESLSGTPQRDQQFRVVPLS